MQSLGNMNKKSIYQCNFFDNSIPLKRGLGFKQHADCQSQQKKQNSITNLVLVGLGNDEIYP